MVVLPSFHPAVGRCSNRGSSSGMYRSSDKYRGSYIPIIPVCGIIPACFSYGMQLVQMGIYQVREIQQQHRAEVVRTAALLHVHSINGFEMLVI